MKTAQSVYTSSHGWKPSLVSLSPLKPQLILVFGQRDLLHKHNFARDIREVFPAAHIMGCSTAGQISGTLIYDDALVLTVIEFEYTNVKGAQNQIVSAADSFATGRSLAAGLMADDLRHLLVLSDGLNVNGSELVRGLTSAMTSNRPYRTALSANEAIKELLSGAGVQFDLIWYPYLLRN